MNEMVSSERDRIGPSRITVRSLRRRRRPDLRSLATGVAVFVAVAWTVVFGVGIVLR